MIARRLLRLGVCAAAVVFFFLGQARITAINKDNFNYEISLCVKRRGQNGIWVPSSGYNYEGMGLDYADYTQWFWQDSAPQCQMRPWTRADFCNIFEKLKLRRIFFVGDSLSHSMADSLWKMLNKKDETPGNQYQGYNKTFRCNVTMGSGTPPFSVSLVYKRNDNLGPDLENNDFYSSHSWGHQSNFHQPWIEPLRQYPYKTLLIANTGMHSEFFGSLAAYQNYFDHFLELAQTFSRPNDYLVYRTSVPGHFDCTRDSSPLMNESDFHVANHWNWPLVQDFNKYSKEKLSNFTDEDGRRKGNWLVLDVYPMTILRPDGHSRPPVDCLHYAAPGPTDFWNHLLINNLLDFVKRDRLFDNSEYL